VTMDSERVEMTMVVRGNSMEDGSLYTILPSGVSPKDLDLVENFRFCPKYTLDSDDHPGQRAGGSVR
jgi:hypothetical protein